MFWGAPIALIGVWPTPLAALVFLAAVGAANTVADASGLTLLQRAVPEEVLARVFGVLESVVLGTIALGAVLAPLLVSWLGVRGALVATGSFLPVLAALVWPRLRALDAVPPPAAAQLELLRAVPIFAPLPSTVLEQLASSLIPVRVAAGEAVFRLGDPGDRFYVIGSGRARWSSSPAEPAVRLGRGGSFGEIALLRDVPRTATTVAVVDAELYALERDEFIAAVTGHPASAEVANSVIAVRLGSLRPGIASV